MTDKNPPKTNPAAVPIPNQQAVLSDDTKILAETRQLYSSIHEEIKGKKESDEVKAIHDLLSEISDELRRYEKEPTNKKNLDDALTAARLARIKLNTITTPQGIAELLSSMLVGVLFILGVGWIILRLLFNWLYLPGVFYLDSFVVAFLGSTASAIIYLGRSSMMRIDSLRTFCNLAASPFVAVILVIMFSELAIGVGGAISATGAETDIVSFTLKGASTELKYAFAFMFGFFGEISVELLRNIMSSASGKE